MDGDFIRRRITELRHSKRLSEYQLSLELGQCKSYIQGITSGKSLPSMQQLFKICRYFHITPAQFFDEGDEYTPLYLQTVNEMKALDAEELKPLSDLIRQIVRLKEEQAQLQQPETDSIQKNE